jgi:hypothetical protein
MAYLELKEVREQQLMVDALTTVLAQLLKKE